MISTQKLWENFAEEAKNLIKLRPWRIESRKMKLED